MYVSVESRVKETKVLKTLSIFDQIPGSGSGAEDNRILGRRIDNSNAHIVTNQLYWGME